MLISFIVKQLIFFYFFRWKNINDFNLWIKEIQVLTLEVPKSTYLASYKQ